MFQVWMNSIGTQTVNGGASHQVKTGSGFHLEPVSGVFGNFSTDTRRNSVHKIAGLLHKKASLALIGLRVLARNAGRCLSLRPQGLRDTSQPFARRYAGRSLVIGRGPALARTMAIGKAASGLIRRGMFASGCLIAGIFCSIALSWKRFSADRLSGLRKCITKTGIGQTTGQRIWNCGLNDNLEDSGRKTLWSMHAGYSHAMAI